MVQQGDTEVVPECDSRSSPEPQIQYDVEQLCKAGRGIGLETPSTIHFNEAPPTTPL